MQSTNHAMFETKIMVNIVRILTCTLRGMLGDTVSYNRNHR